MKQKDYCDKFTGNYCKYLDATISENGCKNLCKGDWRNMSIEVNLPLKEKEYKIWLKKHMKVKSKEQLDKMYFEYKTNRFLKMTKMFSKFKNQDIEKLAKEAKKEIGIDFAKEVILNAASSGYYKREYLENIVKKFDLDKNEE